MRRAISVRVLLAFVLANLFLTWFWTSAFLHQALYLTLLLCVLLACALAVARRRSAKPLFVLTLVSLLASTTIASLEIILHLSPSVLQGELANFAYGRYHTFTGGIYQRDPQTGHRLKPDLKTTTYWAGHWWRHQTNAAGFRGQNIDRAEVIFLGDSMIYGHGVHDNETAPAYFEQQTGLVTANLGQQATSILQTAAIFERVGIPLRPRLVFFCTHFNDIDEPAIWYPKSELDRYLATPVHEPILPVVFKRWHPSSPWRIDHFWKERVEAPLRVRGALAWLFKNGLKAGLGQLQTNTPRPASYEIGSPVPLDHRYRVDADDEYGWRIHRLGIERLRHRCQSIGAELVLFDIGMPSAYPREMRDLAAELGITYSNVGEEVLALALSGAPMYLKNDGHWTARGNFEIATRLARDFAPKLKQLAQNPNTDSTR